MSDSGSSALAGFLRDAPNDTRAAIDIVVDDPACVFNVRGRREGLAPIVEELAGNSLPVEANRVTVGDTSHYWLGPDEYLSVSSMPLDFEDWRNSLVGGGGTVSDVSHGYVSLTISGEKVRDVLAKGCTLDLRESRFSTGDCAQTGIARAAVLIARESGENAFRLLVRRSFAEYLALWLRHAAAEFGVSFREQQS